MMAARRLGDLTDAAYSRSVRETPLDTNVLVAALVRPRRGSDLSNTASPSTLSLRPPILDDS